MILPSHVLYDRCSYCVVKSFCAEVIAGFDFHAPSDPSTWYIHDPTRTLMESFKDRFEILTYTEYFHFSDAHSVDTSAVYRHVSDLPVNVCDIPIEAGTCILSVPDSIPGWGLWWGVVCSSQRHEHTGLRQNFAAWRRIQLLSGIFDLNSY